MNSIEIFSIASGLSSPRYVDKAEFLNSAENISKELHLYPNFKRGYQFASGSDAAPTANDTVDRVRQHPNFFQRSCFLHVCVPRVKNSEGEIHQVSEPRFRPGSGFTLFFEVYAMLLIESGMPVNKASSRMNVTTPRHAFDYRIERAVSGEDPSTVAEVGMDETSRKKDTVM
jgi:hypothetical protein